MFTAVDQERRLEKSPKDLSTLKTICINGKVLELPYVKTFHNTTDDGSFQFFEFNYVKKAKIAICNNAVIWTNKVTGCFKSRFEDDSHKDIIKRSLQASELLD